MRRQAATNASSPSHPPPITPQVTHSQRLRFTTVNPGSTAITFRNLLDTIGFAVTAILGYDLFDQVRLSAVEVWAVPAIGSSTQVAVEFTGSVAGGLGDGRIHSDNSMGVQPAHLVARPSAMSQTAQWQTSSATQAFTVTAPAGAVIDVSLSYRNQSLLAPVAMQNALVAATIGDVVFRGLDGLAVAGTNFPAQAPTVN
jgi:hypothetical protein